MIPEELQASSFPWEELAPDLFGLAVPGGHASIRVRPASEMTGWEVNQPHPYEVRRCGALRSPDGFGKDPSFTTLRVARDLAEAYALLCGWSPLWALGNSKEQTR